MDQASQSASRLGDRPYSVTGREEQVLELAAEGKTDKQIALGLGISPDTVASYWRRILLKFNAASRTEVVGRYAESLALSRINEAEAENQKLRDEIHQRTLSEARELAQRNLLGVISEASLGYISRQKSTRDLLTGLLEGVLSLTQSEYGFIGEVLYDGENPYLKTHALTDITWNPETEALYQIHIQMGLEFRNLNTLFGKVMTSGKVIISNQPREDPRAGGLPPGHPPMSSFLGIPIYSGDEMVGMVGLANRPGGYSQHNVEYLDPIASASANLIMGMRAEQAQRELQRKLQESERLVHRLLDRMPSAVLSEDASRRLVFVNRAFCSMFSIPAEPSQLVGIDCSQAAEASKVMFADPDGFIKRIEELMAGTEDALYERLELADGRVFERDFLLLTQGGKVSGYLWIYREPDRSS